VYHMDVVQHPDRQVVAVDPQYFTAATVVYGRVAAQVHDFGENINDELAEAACVPTPPGDIPFGRKTDGHRNAEASLRKASYAEILPEMSEETIEVVEDVVTHRAAKGVPTTSVEGLEPVDRALDIAHYVAAIGVVQHALKELATQPSADTARERSAKADFIARVHASSHTRLVAQSVDFRFAGIAAAQSAWVPAALSSLNIRRATIIV
jgi:hypothetical protein